MSHHADLRFSDEEVIALYLFGIMNKHREIKQIHKYADRYLRGWFPKLSSYVAFVQRLNKVSDVFAPLLEIIQVEKKKTRAGDSQSLPIDSFPVALAKQGHRFKACLAPELANSGYCSTKKLYFYGIRVYVIGRRQAGTLPRRNILVWPKRATMMEKYLIKFARRLSMRSFSETKPIKDPMQKRFKNSKT